MRSRELDAVLPVSARGHSLAHATLSILFGGAIVACGGTESPLDASQSARGTQCGPQLDFVPINQYADSFGWTQAREEAVVLVNADCSGTYVRTVESDRYVVLTAGHCVELGDRALVTFNFELDGDGPETESEGTVVERSMEPDYALIELLDDPGVEPTPMTTLASYVLTMIHHPLGGPKLVGEGKIAFRTEDQIHYADLDTLVGSSGAGVLNTSGQLVAVHTLGDCAETGTNGGWTARSIVQTSAILQVDDLDGC